MSEMDLDASRAEAARLLTEARWQRVLVTGTLVGGVDPVGNVHIKDWAKIPPGHELYSEDTPDTPHEAAAWLVAKFTNGAPIEGPRYRFRRKPLAPAPEAEQIPEHEAHGHDAAEQPAPLVENRGDNGLLGERAAILLQPERVEEDGHGVERSASPAAGAAVGGELRGFDGGGGDEGALAEPASDDANGTSGFSVAPEYREPTDADFDIIEPAALEASDLADPPALEDLGAEILADEPDAGGVAYFGDDFPTMKLKKIGRLTQIAAEKVAGVLAFAAWDDEEFRAVQNHVAAHMAPATGAYVGERQDLYNRFVELSDVQAQVNTINRHRDDCVAYLNAADTPRLMIEQFDPEAGWP